MEIEVSKVLMDLMGRVGRLEGQVGFLSSLIIATLAATIASLVGTVFTVLFHLRQGAAASPNVELKK